MRFPVLFLFDEVLAAVILNLLHILIGVYGLKSPVYLRLLIFLHHEIEEYCPCFFSQVKDDELEHERKIQEALEKIEKASRASQVVN